MNAQIYEAALKYSSQGAIVASLKDNKVMIDGFSYMRTLPFISGNTLKLWFNAPDVQGVGVLCGAYSQIWCVYVANMSENSFKSIVPAKLSAVGIIKTPRTKGFLFRLPEDVSRVEHGIFGSEANSLCIEVSGSGDCCCLPPTIYHDGAVAEWENEVPFNKLAVVSPRFIFDLPDLVKVGERKNLMAALADGADIPF
ncbi:MAG: hypothetical protein LBO66_07595 [Deltaproteobacteria bacterium]|jgi:hypothetical protein|nr:hypothetical protein [Deltaproteobacteria bacterium]